MVSRIWRWVAIAIAVECVILVGLLRDQGPFDYVGMDFLTSYTGASMIVDGEARNLYDTRAQWEYQRDITSRYGVDWSDRVMHPYIAPPLLAVLAIPLLPLGPASAALVWSSLNLLAVIVGMRLLTRHLDLDWRFAVAIMAGSFPLFYILILGQVEGLLFLAMVVFMTSLREGREHRAGLALAVFAIKPPLLLAPLIYLLVVGRRRTLVTATAATSVQALGSMTLVGLVGVRDFVDLSRRLSGPDGTMVTNVWGMVNIRSIVVRILPNDLSHWVTTVIIALTLLTLYSAIAIWRRAADEAVAEPGLALLAFTMVVTSYHALYHTALFALLGVVLLVAYAQRAGDLVQIDRLTLVSWLCFSLAPLISFWFVHSSKIPAMLAVTGVAMFWATALVMLSQSATTTEPEAVRLSPEASALGD